MAYDLNGTAKKTNYNLNGVAVSAPSIKPVLPITSQNFDLSKSTPAMIEQTPSEPFANTKIGVALNTLKGLLFPGANPKENPYLQVAKDVGQATASSVGSVGVSLANFLNDAAPTPGRVTETKAPSPISGTTPATIALDNPGAIDTLEKSDFKSRVAQDIFSFVFGNEPVSSLEKRIATNELAIKDSPFAQNTGLSKIALPLAFGGVLGDAVLNLTPIGGEENMVKALAQSNDPVHIFKVLLKAGVPEDIATHVAPEFAKVSDIAEVKSMLTATKGLVGTQFIAHNIGGDTTPTIFNTPGWMSDADKAAALADIQDTTVKTDSQILVDDILNGKVKLRVGDDIKREKLDTLGGRYQYIFRKDPNLQTLDSAAGTVGMSGDELLQELKSKIEVRNSAKANITGSQVGKILPSQESALTITPQENPIAPADSTDFLDNSYSDSVNPETGNVNPPAVRGGLKSPELHFTTWNDANTFSLARETFERNIERVANPEDAAKIKQFIVDPIRANEDALVTFTDALKNKVKGFVDELGIKAGSTEDALVQQFGEGKMSITELADKTKKSEEVQQAADFFRNIYDQLLDKVNVSRAEYNYKPIPKHPDYFRHFTEISNVIHQLGILFREQDLPTEISGITDIFKPGKPFSTAELARKGTDSTQSAIKGFDNYIETISKQIFHIDSVQRVRALEKYVRAAAGEDLATLPNFVANINEYGNLIAGKAAKLDRAVESVVGRRMFKAANLMKQQTGISLIAGNISSALTNFIPFTQSLATTEKPAAIKGLLDAFIQPFTKAVTDIDGIESKFLLRRFKQGKIAPNFMEKTINTAGWLFKTIDQFVSHSIVAGKYFELVGTGKYTEEAAMHAADEYAGKVLADRSFGQTPNLFGSKTAGFLTQFQTEVNNMYSFLTKDIPKMSKDKKTSLVSAFAQFFIYSYLMNDAYQYVTGRRPTIDPIYAGLTLLGQTDASHNVSFTERSRMAGKDVAGNLPFGNLIPGLGQGGRLPVASMVPDFKKLSDGDLTQLLNPVSLQLKKSIQGAQAYSKGKVTTPSGKVRFRIPQTNENLIRSILFGPSSLPQATQYYDKLNATQNPATPKKKKYNL